MAPYLCTHYAAAPLMVRWVWPHLFLLTYTLQHAQVAYDIGKDYWVTSWGCSRMGFWIPYSSIWVSPYRLVHTLLCILTFITTIYFFVINTMTRGGFLNTFWPLTHYHFYIIFIFSIFNFDKFGIPSEAYPLIIDLLLLFVFMTNGCLFLYLDDNII